MALLRMASFEDNNLAEILTIGSGHAVAGSARTGSYCMSYPGALGAGNGMSIGWGLPVGEKNEIYLQFGIKKGAGSVYFNDVPHLYWRDYAGNILGGFWLQTSGPAWAVYVGNKATLLGTCLTSITESWQVVQLYIKIDSSVGRVVLKIGETTEIDYTGNTQPGSITTINNIKVGAFSILSGSTPLSYYDDIVLLDTTGGYLNTWPMGLKIYKADAPTANGYYSDWTPSAGDNYQCIDESPPSLTDYLTGSTGNKDSYAFGDAPAGLKGIVGVVTRFYGQGGESIKRLCRHNSTDYLSDAFPLAGAFGKVDDVMVEKPGGGAWTEAVFNACEFGMEKQ